MAFDKQKHADTLLEVETLVCKALMLCEGMSDASCQMGDRQYGETSAGAFWLVAFALERVHELMTDTEVNFRLSHGLHYGSDAMGASNN